MSCNVNIYWGDFDWSKGKDVRKLLECMTSWQDLIKKNNIYTNREASTGKTFCGETLKIINVDKLSEKEGETRSTWWVEKVDLGGGRKAPDVGKVGVKATAASHLSTQYHSGGEGSEGC